MMKKKNTDSDDLLYDYIFKIAIVGNAGVGKTSMVGRYVDRTFKESYSVTIGFGINIVPMKIMAENGQEKNIKLQIWDTAGSERHGIASSTACRGVNGVMFVYSVTDNQSFIDIPKWVEKFKDEEKLKYRVIVGNKADLSDSPGAVSPRNKRNYIVEDIEHIEVSALEGTGLDEAFKKMATTLTNEFIHMNTINNKEEYVILANKNNNNNTPRNNIVEKRNCCGGTS